MPSLVLVQTYNGRSSGGLPYDNSGGGTHDQLATLRGVNPAEESGACKDESGLSGTGRLRWVLNLGSKSIHEKD